MKTPTYQLTVRAVAAAAIALAGSFYSVPALAEAGGTEPGPSASPSATSSPAAAAPEQAPTTAGTAVAPGGTAQTVPGISDAGLAEAVQRDLGMTLEEFNAAGQLGRTAADAVPSLRELPGYLGMSLRDGKILVEGNGPELQARVDELNGAGTAVFTLLPPAAAPATTPLEAPTAAPTPTPTAAPSAADLVASSTEQLFQAYLREVGPAGLQAVAYSGGSFIIRTGGTNTAESVRSPAPDQRTALATDTAAPGKMSAADFVARYANVQLEKGAAIITEAPVTSDIFGGQGYVTDVNTICSAGFGAFERTTGEPTILTAGHCAEDGVSRATEVEPASSSTAGGSTTALTRPLAALGTFGFSQFGGPGNSVITGTQDSPGNVGTDIAVIEGLAPGVNVRPAASKWDNVANPDFSAVKIIGKTAPFQGQSVCRSGRTTGWKCGTVDSVGIWVIPGPKSLPPRYDNDLRAVHAFDSTSVKSSGGDSGGPWISGNFAVGTHTGAEKADTSQLRAIASTLEDALAQVPGFELQLFLNKPELVAPENRTFRAGQDIPGRVPAAPASAVAANSKVLITVEGQAPVEVPVDGAGNWALPAQGTAGRVNFSAETVNGFSRSGAASFAVQVSDLDAPVITMPADSAALKAVTRVDGTGTPGLTVKLTGDITGSAVVTPDGRWSIPVTAPVYGQIAVHAVQTAPSHLDSPSMTRNFTVTPAAPAVASIVDGVHLSQDALPETISGTGVDGADVSVSVDGAPVGAAQAGAGGAGAGARAVVRSMLPQVLVAGGRWSVPFPSGLAVGTHTLAVAQSVDGIASAPLLLSFSIDARVVLPAASSSQPEQARVLPVGSGQLPNTGAGSVLPAAGLAGASLLLGGALLVLGRRRAPKAVPLG
ncbi:hypothetical protein BJG92_00109 [Arthrobacter sp. SO5]|uniref:S1 family peptidase n=1 Tax=Arthrobacter sp. SO5 TaxID=1897055 RepID=UPI001E3A71DD|nr:S1 family peptidase [Arthrobacter sp. SO5]MCB5272607.1 hypothetical protein [Arthrobacter sp. SO5]